MAIRRRTGSLFGQILGRRDPINKSDPQRLLRVDEVPVKQEFQRLAVPTRRARSTPAITGRESDLHVAFGTHAEVDIMRMSHIDAMSVPRLLDSVDRGDDGLVEVLEGQRNPVNLVVQLLLALQRSEVRVGVRYLGQIDPGAEGAVTGAVSTNTRTSSISPRGTR